MNSTVSIKSTSKVSAVGDDIVLREKTTTRLIFRPELVDNPNNPQASVRGTFIFQRKKPTNSWEDYKVHDLNRLKDAEGVKLELHAAELMELMTTLNQYYDIFEKYGIQRGETEFIVTPRNAKEVIRSFLRNPENFTRLQELTLDDLEKLTTLSSINSLQLVLTTWDEQKENGKEEFWQSFFEQHSWVLGQVFSSPVVLFQGKALVGGKRLDNTGGKAVDFIFKHGYTDNVLLVEIKTPTTPMLGKLYRNDVFCPSSELSGGISQLLGYKQAIQEHYHSLRANESREFYAFNPKCLLVIGNASTELTTKHHKKFLSLLRNDSRQIEIVTFDELFEKIRTLVKLLEG